ncbi:MAG TPA: hypothetical protein VHT91_16185 [Kofleriaceae bacterium]|jgi:hypothetical protein|nr:hypothetical protein [Kofleriaceae bacterium]
MPDARWVRLKDCLLDRGWTAREEVLYAPRERMRFSRISDCSDDSDNLELSAFRDQIRSAADTSAECIALEPEHAELHDDLVSLADALDEVFQN